MSVCSKRIEFKKLYKGRLNLTKLKNMDEKRKGEIAFILLKYQLSREGIRLGPDMKRELGNIAKATDIPLSELKEFGRDIFKEMLNELLTE